MLRARMGKNQAYKAMQKARLGSSSAAPEQIEDGMVCPLSYYPVSAPILCLRMCLIESFSWCSFNRGPRSCFSIEGNVDLFLSWSKMLLCLDSYRGCSHGYY